jgi:sugar diacid utilization regulator
MDPVERALLDRLEQGIDATLDRMAESIAATVAYEPIRDAALPGELRRLARQHVLAFARSARGNRAVEPGELEFVRERATQRAREMVPLAATVHGHLVAQRTTIEALAGAAGSDSRFQAAALRLVARLSDYTAAAVTVLVESYIQTIEGERADREADRRNLLEELLTGRVSDYTALARRAPGLGLEPGRTQVVVIATVVDAGGASLLRRWAAETLARKSGRGASHAFVVVRTDDVVSVLDSTGDRQARVVLDEVRRAAQASHGARLRAGIGTPFADIGGLATSFDEARRALRHACERRPIVCSPDDITLFDDLALSSGEAAERLIPARVRRALADETLRATLHAYVDANLNVAATAKELILHPNSVRYRLRRIASLTGRDPRQVADLFELRAAARLLDTQTGHASFAELPPRPHDDARTLRPLAIPPATD